MTTWDVDQAQRIGVAIKALRGDRSAQWLSEQTAEIGMPISRSTIADIENRRRRYVTTAELSVLAWALAVPPVRLLYPDLPDGSVEAVPGVTVSSMVAVTWFSGEATLGPGPEDVAAWSPTELQRHDLRERALYNAVNLHCETGDAMDRQTAAADVLATAQEFYDWITEDLAGHPNPETLCTCGHEQDEHKPVGGCGAYNITAGRELHCRCDTFERQE